MATKAEIVKEIKALDPSVEISDSLKLEELEALLAKTIESADKKADEELAEVVGKLAKAPGVYVCAGRSITSGKGILNEGSGPHKASLFGDKANLTRLVKAGCLEIVS